MIRTCDRCSTQFDAAGWFSAPWRVLTASAGDANEILGIQGEGKTYCASCAAGMLVIRLNEESK